VDTARVRTGDHTGLDKQQLTRFLRSPGSRDHRATSAEHPGRFP
jgi:hypothetical protein